MHPANVARPDSWQRKPLKSLILRPASIRPGACNVCPHPLCHHLRRRSPLAGTPQPPEPAIGRQRDPVHLVGELQFPRVLHDLAKRIDARSESRLGQPRAKPHPRPRWQITPTPHPAHDVGLPLANGHPALRQFRTVRGLIPYFSASSAFVLFVCRCRCVRRSSQRKYTSNKMRSCSSVIGGSLAATRRIVSSTFSMACFHVGGWMRRPLMPGRVAQ